MEIDESKFGRRKYNRGRYVDGHWVFGGTERITGESFLVEVTKRDAATLLPIIRQHIKPGSVIYSDEWRAYCRIQRMGYSHLTVNHSVNFVDPNTGAHTQSVESMWSACKRMMREEKTMHSSLFDTYLPEFMWRRKFDTFHSDSFSNILKHISEQYIHSITVGVIIILLNTQVVVKVFYFLVNYFSLPSSFYKYLIFSPTFCINLFCIINFTSILQALDTQRIQCSNLN